MRRGTASNQISNIMLIEETIFQNKFISEFQQFFNNSFFVFLETFIIEFVFLYYWI